MNQGSVHRTNRSCRPDFVIHRLLIQIPMGQRILGGTKINLINIKQVVLMM